MIHKLKRRFTVLATVSMLVLMSVLVVIMNIVNYSSVVKESDETLTVLAQPNAPFFDVKEPENDIGPQTEIEPPKDNRDFKDFIPRGMSFEVPFESRFFSVTVDKDGGIVNSDFSRIVSVGDAEASTYVEKATASNKTRGFIGNFRFLKVDLDDKSQIYFLDCGRKLDAFTSFLWTSLSCGLLGCVIVFVAFLFVSGKIVKPIAESYEKQKRFISDASHEIKTPLTIIAANADLLEADGEKEELIEIKNQTKRLSALTKDLVTLSKMEEGEQKAEKIDCPFSDIVEEAVAAFHAPAQTKNIVWQTEIEKGITLCGAPDALNRLLSVLTENAVKYAKPDGKIFVTLKKNRKSVFLSIANETESPISADDLPHLFDRFYRTDTSRNSATGGHGIGLSIAKAVADAHGGVIAATYENGVFAVNVTLPL